MKKLILLLMVFTVAWTFQACNNSTKTETDSVEAAEDSNEAMNTAVQEDDSEFLVKAASGGMMEVELGKMASQKASSPDVKNFGQMMVTDHSKANEELKALAASKNMALPASVGEDHQKHIDDLSKLSGADFDKKYVSLMVDDHKEDIEEFEEASRDAKDADIKAFANKTLPVLKKHYDSVKAIKDKM